MSLDANYILVYDNLPYAIPTPMEKDIQYLRDKFGGEFIYIDSTSIFWEKPKYTLLMDEYSKLHADQILERRDCELWKIIK
jgi:hypothetical protein